MYYNVCSHGSGCERKSSLFFKEVLIYGYTDNFVDHSLKTGPQTHWKIVMESLNFVLEKSLNLLYLFVWEACIRKDNVFPCCVKELYKLLLY